MIPLSNVSNYRSLKMNKRDTEHYKETISKELNEGSTTIEAEPTVDDRAAPLTVSPPEAEPESKPRLVQEEVSYEQFVKKETVVRDDENVDYADEIKSLVGSSADTVEQYLQQLKKRKIIPDYLIMPVGGVTLMEHRPGFVTALKEVSGMIVDITIS